MRMMPLMMDDDDATIKTHHDQFYQNGHDEELADMQKSVFCPTMVCLIQYDFLKATE